MSPWPATSNRRCPYMASKNSQMCVCIRERLSVRSYLCASSISTWGRDLDLEQSWKSVTVLPLEFACTPLGQKQVRKGRLECCSPLLTIGVCVCVCVSVFLGFYDSGDLDESQGKPFCFCLRAVCLSLGPHSVSLPPSPGYALSLLFVYINIARSRMH